MTKIIDKVEKQHEFAFFEFANFQNIDPDLNFLFAALHDNIAYNIFHWRFQRGIRGLNTKKKMRKGKTTQRKGKREKLIHTVLLTCMLKICL